MLEEKGERREEGGERGERREERGERREVREERGERRERFQRFQHGFQLATPHHEAPPEHTRRRAVPPLRRRAPLRLIAVGVAGAQIPVSVKVSAIHFIGLRRLRAQLPLPGVDTQPPGLHLIGSGGHCSPRHRVPFN